MFSAAFKSFSSNISANYEVGKTPIANSGAWMIFDGRKKTSESRVSIFVFDRKSLEAGTAGFGARTSATSLRKAQDEVVERLKKEASSLARLRHPSILQLVEPAEDTRTGGLMFATEPVTASLAGLLADKDREEGIADSGKQRSRYVVQDVDGTRRRREVEMDELEIQKGLLQVAKGLEFLHESAGLVHGNVAPEAIYINTKSDWKISGLSFAGSPDGARGHQSLQPIPLSEVLYHDHRLPRSVQLNLDFASPDFVLDGNATTSADIFSLGLVAVALYNSPHRSPIETNGNQSAYKRIFDLESSSPSARNEFLSSRPLPRELKQTLPQLLARRPAQRISAREFQQSAYFDNILVNTIRFLDALPAKTPAEKAQFMRGLGRVMPQFPASVLGKKVLIALLDELKDKELLSLILTNVFKIVKTIPAGRRIFPEKVLPAFREIFLTRSSPQERDTSKDPGMAVVIENMGLIVGNCSAKEFKDDVLPITNLAMESSSHMLVDATLKCLPTILPVLDYSTIKNDLFPCVATVFSKTSSLGIKVSGLKALFVLCGGSVEKQTAPVDDLSGLQQDEKKAKTASVTALDKYTVQEKVVPLIKAIKTKEPPVMMAALDVLQQVGKVADTEFLALDVLPVLWSFSLGPLLEIQQFRSFMDLIKSLSSKIEREQARKLQDLSASNKSASVYSTGVASGPSNNFNVASLSTGEDEFERLVLGRAPSAAAGTPNTSHNAAQAPTFSWSSASNVQNNSTSSRSITPDTALSAFPPLQPGANNSPVPGLTDLSPSPWTTERPSLGSHPLTPAASRPANSSTTTQFAIPPPPSSSSSHQPKANYNIATTAPLWNSQPQQNAGLNSTAPLPPPLSSSTYSNQLLSSTSSSQQPPPPPPPPQQQKPSKSGLDKYQSLL